MNGGAEDRLAFYRSIFPETLYLIPEAESVEVAPEMTVSKVGPPTTDPAVVLEKISSVDETIASDAGVTASPVAQMAAAANEAPPLPVKTAIAEEKTASVVAPSTALHSAAKPVQAYEEKMTPIALSSATAQQSRGDGSGALIVQRLPSAEFAKLNQNPFWQRFLQFLKLDWATVRFVNVLTPEPLTLESLRAAVPNATRMLLFGEDLVQPMPPTLPKYQVLEGKTMRVLMAHAVADLDDERKRALMTALPTLLK